MYSLSNISEKDNEESPIKDSYMKVSHLGKE